MKQHEGSSTSAGLSSLLAGLGAAAGSIAHAVNSTQNHGARAAYKHCMFKCVAPQALFGLNPLPQVCCSKSVCKSTIPLKSTNLSILKFTQLHLRCISDEKQTSHRPIRSSLTASLFKVHSCGLMTAVLHRNFQPSVLLGSSRSPESRSTLKR